MDYNETPTKGFTMNRNDKIVLAMAATVSLASAGLFAYASHKARKATDQINERIDAAAKLFGADKETV